MITKLVTPQEFRIVLHAYRCVKATHPGQVPSCSHHPVPRSYGTAASPTAITLCHGPASVTNFCGWQKWLRNIAGIPWRRKFTLNVLTKSSQKQKFPLQMRPEALREPCRISKTSFRSFFALHSISLRRWIIDF